MFLKSIAQKIIELRANRIPDPVGRLRYLQKRIGLARPAPRSRSKAPILLFFVLLASLLVAYKPSTTEARQPFVPLPRVSATGADVFTTVWLVDQTKDFEIYSNGLRIDDRYSVSQRIAAQLTRYTGARRSIPLNRNGGPRPRVSFITPRRAIRRDSKRMRRRN